MNSVTDPTVSQAIIERILRLIQDDVLTDVRLGLGYSAVQLDHGGVGICWSPKSNAHTCTVFGEAGTLVGRPAAETVPWLKDASRPWHRAIGLATVNAVLNQATRPPAESTDIISRLDLHEHDRVAMVGRFQPLLKSIRSSGCHLDVIELEASDPDSLSPLEGRQALRTCSVAILTGTSLVTGTLDGLLEDLAGSSVKARAVVLLGPSVPLFPEAFRATAITHLAGSWIRDAQKVLQVVSEGGGTPQLKPSLVTVTQHIQPIEQERNR